MLKTMLTAMLALLVAAPADARISGGTAGGWPAPPGRPLLAREPAGPGVRGEVRELHDRVERARDGGQIARGEARQLKREARLIGRLGERYGRDGLSPSEQAELRNRIHSLGSAIYAAAGRGSNADRANRKGR
jgi:hypothetical protein